MQPLRPFTNSSVAVTGQLAWDGPALVLQFALKDPAAEVQDSLNPGRWTNWPRADELWKTTCFEAFIAKPGENGYWEINLSPSRKAWNLYHFTGYREPQPPSPSNDFELTEIKMTKDTLHARLFAKIPLSDLDVSLTAVVRGARGAEYFALHHAGAKADFHLRDSFTFKLKK